MAKPTGFLEYKRQEPRKRTVAERIKNYQEFEIPLSVKELQKQAARCMDCGVPSCHSFGCPVANRIPDWNEMVYRGHWQRALELLHATNNFPEITGRICPAPCEPACTLSINQEPVTIKHIELQIVEMGWRNGWIHPEIPFRKTGKKVAIIGSGPAGLAAAQQLVRAGHNVAVFEKSDRIGGLLRYGIPDYKLDKSIIDRRLDHMIQEGIHFETSVDAGVDLSTRYMKRSFDVILLTTGATIPRDINVRGRGLEGIHFAMDFLTQQNRRNAGDQIPAGEEINARDKQVVVIGGGDTGADCVGTAIRQGARKITQIELLPKPPLERVAENPWPTWPNILRTATAHEEGCERLWSVLTKGFSSTTANAIAVKSLRCVKLDWSTDSQNNKIFREIRNSDFEIPADLVLVAAGFVHAEHGALVNELELPQDQYGNIAVDKNYMTSNKAVFAAGDCVRGASLVVTAIQQGRKLAESVNCYLGK
jgi:glutamate synthase (NADPH/NADH) small chain